MREVSGSGPGFHRDIGVVIYEAMTSSVGGQWFMYWLSKWI